MFKQFLLFILFAIVISSNAFTEDAPSLANTAFDVAEAHKQLDDLNLRLATEELELTNLEAASGQIKRLYNQAEHCVTNNQKELTEINTQLAFSIAEVPEDGAITVDRAFLQNKSSELTKTIAECRLFILRSDDAIDIYDKKIQQLIQHELYTAEPTYWENLQHIPQFLTTYDERLNFVLLNNFIGINQLSHWLLILLAVLVILGSYLGIRSKYKVELSLTTLGSDQYYSPLALQLLNTYKKYSLGLWTIIPSVGVLILWTIGKAEFYLISYVAIAAGIYLMTMFFASLMFYAPTQSKHPLQLPNEIAFLLLVRLRVLLISSFFIGTIYLILLPQPIDLQIKQAISTTLFSILTLSMLWLALLLPVILKLDNSYKKLYRFLLLVAILALNLIEWLGYHSLSHHLLYAGLMSILLLTLIGFAHKLISYLFNMNNNGDSPWLTKVYKMLGVKSHRVLPEIFTMKVLIIFMAWLLFFVSLVKVWDISDQDFYLLLNTVFNGFHLLGFEIIPAKIILAVTLFIILVLFTRFLKSAYLNYSTHQLHRGAKEAIATIIGYIGFGFASIITLIIAGVNFTGIALVLGGLSVGVGLGLQNIVNNFVSGIILLIERPIKLGDRIVVGDTEGFVKKISIRSTQIATLLRSDVIVPNSELISSQVTNLMFKDDFCRISVTVGVAYGSDVELVKRLLLQIAKEHESVITDNEELTPVILFKDFGDSSLVFDMWCIIRNVNHKYITASDLHFAIDKIFRANGVTIAFPQRDLHIKNWPPVEQKQETSEKTDTSKQDKAS